MEPICFSQYFVNKQNLRSCDSVIPRQALRSFDKFVKLLIDDENLVKNLSSHLSNTLDNLRKNIQHNSKKDFSNYFPRAENSTKLDPVNKDFVIEGCLKALSQIMPKTFYGSNQNIKIFNKLIKTVILSMSGENIDLMKLISNWKFNNIIWQSAEEINILVTILIWMLTKLVSAILSLNFYITTCKLSCDEYKLYYFWKNEWQSFYDNKIYKMRFSNILKRSETDCCGKRVKRRLSFGDRLRLKTQKKNIPKLYLILKPNNECRPIVRYRSSESNKLEKNKIKERLNFLKMLSRRRRINMEQQYKILSEKWFEVGKPSLYFVKTDLTNAFGSINKELLLKILAEKQLKYQIREQNLTLKNKYAQMYKDFVSELRRPLLVRAGSTIYEWNKGLVQGYKYSPALSELYYNYLDSINFREIFINKERCIIFFARVVDDYLFITDSLQTAKQFIDALSKYNNVNYGKTEANFEYQDIKYKSEITFLGYTYNTKNLEVSRANNAFAGQMCFKIAFSNAVLDLNSFLDKRIGQSGVQINGHIFNLYYNSEELVWNHVFSTLCISANKFCTILAIVCDENEMGQYLMLYKTRVTVKLNNAIIKILLRNKPDDYVFRYCMNHFKYLAWKALLICAQRTPKCNGLVPLINVELAKCNCIFGKWREHSSFIDSSGTCRKLAVREVCTRLDLRVIMRKFDKPHGLYQFYNPKSRL